MAIIFQSLGRSVVAGIVLLAVVFINYLVGRGKHYE